MFQKLIWPNCFMTKHDNFCKMNQNTNLGILENKEMFQNATIFESMSHCALEKVTGIPLRANSIDGCIRLSHETKGLPNISLAFW